MSENEIYSRAEKIVDEKIGFYHHLYSYIVVNVILAIVNILSILFFHQKIGGLCGFPSSGESV